MELWREELQLPVSFWKDSETDFKAVCILSQHSLIYSLSCSYPSRPERLFPRLYLICEDSSLFLHSFVNPNVPFIYWLFSCSESPPRLLWHSSTPSAHFYTLKWRKDLLICLDPALWCGWFDDFVALPPLTFFQGISFTPNQCAEPDCNLCCVINRPLAVSLSLPFSFFHTIKDQLALMCEKTL